MLRFVSRGFAAVRAGGRYLRRDESGSVVTFLVVVPVLAGTVALGVETGQLYRIKRQMQSAADAAAIAGSVDRINGANTTTITTDGKYEAQRNGFTDGANSVTVTINSPPLSGSNINTTGAVEAIVTKTQTFSLGAIINSWMGVSNSGFTMRARSVAAQSSYTTTTSNATGCIVALTTAAEQGINMSSFNNYASDCSVISNGSSTSSNSNASIYLSSFNTFSLTKGSTTDTPLVWSRGSLYKSSYNSYSATTQLNQTSYITDPYAGLPTPSPGACSYTNYNVSSGSSVTLTPGTYCGGITISGVNNVYFTAGTYYVANGDLYITSVNNVSCSDCTGGAGTTIVLTQTTGNNSDIGGFKITSDNNVTLNAPSSGTYQGVVVYQDRRATVGTMSTTSKIFTLSSLNNAKLQGVIYFPNNRIDLSSLNNTGNSTDGCTVWIGRYIKFSSYNNTYIVGCSAVGATPATVTTTTTVSKARVLE